MRLRALLAVAPLLACASAPSPAPAATAVAPKPAPLVAKLPVVEELPLGGAAARISGPASGFTTACQAAMAQTRAGLDAVKASPAPRNTVATLTAYDDALAAINDLDTQAETARQGSPNKDLRTAAEECDRQIQALSTTINQDRALYDALSGLDLSGQDAATVWWMKRDLREFRRAGVDRDDATRAKVRALNDEIVTIGQEFDRNIREGGRKVSFTPTELAGLPEDFRKAHPAGADGKVVLTTDYPDFRPFMAYARSATARERFFRAFSNRASPENIDVLKRLLDKRYQLATLLGYANWADYATETKMIESGKAASAFIDRISAAADARSKREISKLLARKRKDVPGGRTLEPWDYGYYSNRVKAEQFHFDAKAARPYFETGHVIRGVLDTSGKLFDLTYRPVEGATVWHTDVRVYDVIAGPSFGDRAGKTLGRIYLDLHPREGKFKHAAQFALISGQEGRRLPEGALLCNFSPPGGLMEYGEVRTMFHEFGHLVHHIVGGNTRWAANSGIRNESDFGEAPSQMLEEWMRDPGVLGTFALHEKTGKPIPPKMVSQLLTAEEFGKGVDVQTQMFYAATSLKLHDRNPQGLEPTPFLADVQAHYAPFPYVPGTTYYTAFGHLNGYSALYYTYMWSLVIAKDLFTPFKAHGVFDRETATRYRQKVLEPGGGKPSAQLVADFLGRPYDFKAYEAWLAK